MLTTGFNRSGNPRRQMAACVLVLILYVAAECSFGQAPGIAPRSTLVGADTLGPKRTPGIDTSISTAPAMDEDATAVRVATNLVVNEISVVDKKGRPILGLTKDDFSISEDSVRQEIEVFESGGSSRVARSIVLIIDHSYSEVPFIDTSIEAAKTLINSLHPADRVAIVTDDVEFLTGFTSDKQLLSEHLDGLKTKALSGNCGRSRQYSALSAVLNELIPASPLRPIILFQTDGDQLMEFTNFRTDAWQNTDAFKRLLSAAKNQGTPIYTVVPGPNFLTSSRLELLRNAERTLRSEAHRRGVIRSVNDKRRPMLSERSIEIRAEASRRDQMGLQYLATASGGDIFHLEKPADAESVYANVLQEMNRRYVLGYYPTNQERDGKRRTIRISVRGQPSYTIRGKEAYVAEPSLSREVR